MSDAAPDREARDKTLSRVLFVCFHDYFCRQEGISAFEKPGVSPFYFLGWLLKSLETGALNVTELMGQARVEYADWEQFLEVIRDPLAAERLRLIWPQITLGDRPAPTSRVQRVVWNLLVEFEDGKLFSMQNLLLRELTEFGRIDDGLLGSYLTEKVGTFLDALMQYGLEGMHQQADAFGGEEPFNVLMGAFLRIIPQLKPEYRESTQNYMRLCQLMIQPPLAPQIAARVEAVRQQEQAATAQGSPDGLRGGWDTD